MRRLAGQRFRAPVWRGSEVNGGQNRTDQHQQQVDFHVVLRCAIAARLKAESKTRSSAVQ
jgi:hypothetical protein